MPYFRGQGKVLMGLRDVTTSVPLDLYWIGNCPDLKVSFATTKLTHKESYSGNNLTDVQIITEKTSSFSATIEEFNAKNLAMLLNGTAVSNAGVIPVTGATILGSSTPVVGQFFMLPRRGLSAVVIKDSTGSPKTLTVSTNYKLYAKEGMIEILDVTTGGPFIGPLKADYTPSATSEVAMFNAATQDMWLRFIGMNMANNGVPCTVDLFKIQLDPTKDFSLIGDDINKFVLDGSVMMDPTRLSNDILGQFGSIALLT